MKMALATCILKIDCGIGILPFGCHILSISISVFFNIQCCATRLSRRDLSFGFRLSEAALWNPWWRPFCPRGRNYYSRVRWVDANPGKRAVQRCIKSASNLHRAWKLIQLAFVNNPASAHRRPALARDRPRSRPAVVDRELLPRKNVL